MLGSRNIPSVAPRGDTEIGTVRGGNKVFISREFLRWLDGLRFRLQDTVTRAGTIIMTHETGEPDGWLVLNGQQVTERLYPRLAAIYGATGGIVTLPDMTNLLPMGAGSLVGNNETAGVSEITLSTEQMPRHSHPTIDQGHNHGAVDRGHEHSLQLDSHGHEATAEERAGFEHSHGLPSTTHTHTNGVRESTGNQLAAGTDYPNFVLRDVGGSSIGFGETETATTALDIAVTIEDAEVNGTVSPSHADICVHKAMSNITIEEVGDGASIGILNPVRGFYYWVKT